jgi:hypothetical protein
MENAVETPSHDGASLFLSQVHPAIIYWVYDTLEGPIHYSTEWYAFTFVGYIASVTLVSAAVHLVVSPGRPLPWGMLGPESQKNSYRRDAPLTVAPFVLSRIRSSVRSRTSSACSVPLPSRRSQWRPRMSMAMARRLRSLAIQRQTDLGRYSDRRPAGALYEAGAKPVEKAFGVDSNFDCVAFDYVAVTWGGSRLVAVARDFRRRYIISRGIGRFA